MAAKKSKFTGVIRKANAKPGGVEVLIKEVQCDDVVFADAITIEPLQTKFENVE